MSRHHIARGVRVLRYGSPFLLVAGVVLPAVVAHAQESRLFADALGKKLAVMSSQGAAPLRKPMWTTVTERELNAYLVDNARTELPAGVVDPAVSILGTTGRVSGRAVVDLDRVRKEKKPASWLDPVSYLTGRLPLTTTGILTTKNGVGQFRFESASVAGVPVPKLFVQQVVSYYSRSPARPSGINLDRPFTLPAHIHEIRFGRGEAIVIQQ